MLGPRPFRFGAAPYATTSAAEYFDTARRIEALGFATMQTADHFNLRWFEPGPALMAAALAMGGLLWLEAALVWPLAGAHGLAQAAMLGVLTIAGVAIYGLLLALFGVINWADAIGAVRHSPPRDLRG